MRTVVINDSDLVWFIEYDPEEQYMVMALRNGVVYEYHNVANHEFGQIVAAESIGKAANVFWRTNPGKRLDVGMEYWQAVHAHLRDNLAAWREQYGY